MKKVAVPGDFFRVQPIIAIGILIAMSSFLRASLIAMLLMAALIVVPSSSSAAPFTQDLRLGSVGAEVFLLQQTLKDKGFFSYPTITGYFGAATQSAVSAFQASAGLPQVGQVGPQTRALLNSTSGSMAPSAPPVPVAPTAPAATQVITRQLSLGVTGTDVIELQRFLAAQGYYTYPTITGYYGPVTAAAVAAYQQAKGLPPVGEVGPQTRALINAGLSSPNSGYTSTGNGGSAQPVRRGNPPPRRDDDAPEISGVASTPGVTTATITWTTDEDADAQVEYGTTSSYGQESALDTSRDESHSIELTGLTANTTYHFRVRSADDEDNVAYSDDYTFTTQSGGGGDITAPAISSVASSTGQTTATITWTTDEAASSRVVYGPTISYGSASSSAAFVTSHSLGLTGLTAATSYHFRVVSTDASGNTATSSDYTFTTAAAPDVTAPVISSVATSTSDTTATITWTTDEPGNSRVAYGSTPLYGIASMSSTLVTSHSITLTGLTPSTTYHYQVTSRDAAGNIGSTTDATFTTSATPDVTAPVITSVATSTADTTATITWTTDEAADSRVAYGATSSYGTASTSATLTTSHSLSLSGLTPSTTYNYQVASRDAAGNTASTTNATFTTTAAPDTTAPVISNVSVATTTTTATITWTTNEAATSTVNYGTTTGYGSASSSAALLTSHSITLTGLTAATLYNYQISVADAAGNIATTTNATFTTESDVVLDGTVTAVSIQSVGHIADITVKGLSTAGTFALTPDTTPKLTFNVTSSGYNSSGSLVSQSRTVYGTVPARYPYPNIGQGTTTITPTPVATTTETVSGGNLNAQVWLSEDILAGDTVTLTGLSGWYTQGTSTRAVSNLSATNNSTATSSRPIGAWVTPTNLRRAPGESFTVEFVAVSQYPRNNGQVAAVTFTASDGSASVSKTVSTMTQSTYLFSTTCTATSGSAVLTSCGRTEGIIPGQYVTVQTGSGSAVSIGNPRISTVDSSSQVTLNTNAASSGSVTLTLGNPVYVYAATFTNSELNTLANGRATVRAVAYSNVGNSLLDTQAGADGVAIASGTITPNLKNLQFANDKNDNYAPVYAWVNPSGTAGASPAVQLTQTDPGSTAYYANISAAAMAIRTYYNANKGHNDACGGVVYLKAGTTTGFGTTAHLGTGGASPTNCMTYLTVSAEPGKGATDVTFLAGASGNPRASGYTTLFRGIKFVDDATNKVVFQGPDAGNLNTRLAHNIFQYSWLLETQAATSAFINQVGWREYYNSLLDQTTGNSSMLAPFSNTGVTNTQFGTTALGAGSVWAYTSLGNMYTAPAMRSVQTSSPNYIVPTSVLVAFDKLMGGGGNPFIGGTWSNFAFVQNVIEQTGTVDTQAAYSFSADSDITPLSNYLRQYQTTVGGRSNVMYQDVGSTRFVKTGANLYNIDFLFNSKSDYFVGPGGPSGERTGNWRWRFGVGAVGNVSGPSSANHTSAYYDSWLGDYFGRPGNTTTPGYNQTSFTYRAANQNSSNGGNNTGLGYYKAQTTTGLTNRVPAGAAGFPGDIEGTPRKNDGTGCAGAYEC